MCCNPSCPPFNSLNLRRIQPPPFGVFAAPALHRIAGKRETAIYPQRPLPHSSPSLHHLHLRNHSHHMVAATQTQTYSHTSHHSQGGTSSVGSLKVRAPSSNTAHASRLSAPLPLTGAFERYGVHHSDVTPALGTEFDRGSLDLAALLSADDDKQRELLTELASLGESYSSVFFLLSGKF